MQLEFSLEGNDLTLNSWKNITDKKLKRQIYGKFYRKINQKSLYEKKKIYCQINRDQISKQKKTYYQINKDKKIEYAQAYRKANKDRVKTMKKAWCEANKDKIKIWKKAYYEANKEKVKLRKQIWRSINKEQEKTRNKIYYNNNRDKINEKRKQYYTNKKNINARLSRLLRSRLNCALKRNPKSSSAVKDLGCSIDELKVYLESKFKPGMSWENHGFYGWHIDHIKPLSSFDLTNKEQLLQAVHYTNLQPLWAKDNLSKANKY
jgi:hypothetical protein